MNFTNNFCVLTLLAAILLLATVTSAPPQQQQQSRLIDEQQPLQLSSVPPHSLGSHRRSKRAFGDFFTKVWSVASLGKAQYDDTRTTLAKIYEILRDSFSDTMVKKTPAVVVQSGTVGNGTSSSSNEVTETTTEKYRISRKELSKILNRNFRGLKRLAEIERRDAQNATKYNIKEYKVQLANSLQSFVYNLPSN